jgi:hypothetical protein
LRQRSEINELLLEAKNEAAAEKGGEAEGFLSLSTKNVRSHKQATTSGAGGVPKQKGVFTMSVANPTSQKEAVSPSFNRRTSYLKANDDDADAGTHGEANGFHYKQNNLTNKQTLSPPLISFSFTIY